MVQATTSCEGSLSTSMNIESELSPQPSTERSIGKIHTLDDLKAALIQMRGEKEGIKHYDAFLRSFAIHILHRCH